MIVRVQHSRASAGGATQRRFAQHRVLQRLKRIEWGAMHVRVCIVCGLLGGEGNKSRHAAVRPPPTRRGALRVPPPQSATSAGRVLHAQRDSPPAPRARHVRMGAPKMRKGSSARANWLCAGRAINNAPPRAGRPRGAARLGCVRAI